MNVERGRWVSVEAAAAVVLIGAAGLKWLHLATGAVPDVAPAWDVWSRLGLIEFELAWGLWLLGGRAPRVTAFVSAILFLALAVVSATRGLWGHASCGCFGPIQINPWVTMTLDLALAAGFGLALRKPAKADHPSPMTFRRLIVVFLAVSIVGVPLALAAPKPSAVAASAGDRIPPAVRYVVVDPERLRGGRLPLLDYMTHREELERGHWRLFVYRSGCPTCHEALRKFPEGATMGRVRTKSRWALVELPPLDTTSPLEPPPVPPGHLVSHLDAGKTWVADVPFTLDIVDGVVE